MGDPFDLKVEQGPQVYPNSYNICIAILIGLYIIVISIIII